MKERTIENISRDIQIKREEMVMVANQYGLTHELTIRNSQDLDQLINEYQMFSMKKKNRKKIIYSYARRYCKTFYNRILKLQSL